MMEDNVVLIETATGTRLTISRERYAEIVAEANGSRPPPPLFRLATTLVQRAIREVAPVETEINPIHAAIRRVRDRLLSDRSDRQAARIIDAAARGRAVVGVSSALRNAVKKALICELKRLDDIPRFEMLRKILKRNIVLRG